MESKKSLVDKIFTLKIPIERILPEASLKEIEKFLPHGWGNGYLYLPKGHPWYGIDYDSFDYNSITTNIPWGFTYATEETIHYPGQLCWEDMDTYWVLGFDTMHYGNNIIDHDETWIDNTLASLKQDAVNILNNKLLKP